jgi:hypothetical protein
MPAVFNKHGMNFQYPENWEVQENFAADQALEIYLLAPTGAFWSMLAFSADSNGDQLMKDVLASFDQQYDGFECAATNDVLAETRLTGFDSHFFCLDMLVTNKMRTLTVDQHNLLIMSQAESREFEKQELVFDAITTSLLTGLQE